MLPEGWRIIDDASAMAWVVRHRPRYRAIFGGTVRRPTNERWAPVPSGSQVPREVADAGEVELVLTALNGGKGT